MPTEPEDYDKLQNSFIEFNSKVDAISGATISVNSLKTSIFKKTQNLKRIINE